MRSATVGKPRLAALATVGVLAAALSFLAPAVSAGPAAPASTAAHAFAGPQPAPAERPQPTLPAAVLPLAVVVAVLPIVLPHHDASAGPVATPTARRRRIRGPPGSR